MALTTGFKRNIDKHLELSFELQDLIFRPRLIITEGSPQYYSRTKHNWAIAAAVKLKL